MEKKKEKWRESASESLCQMPNCRFCSAEPNDTQHSIKTTPPDIPWQQFTEQPQRVKPSPDYKAL
jgi:hypothetical protein